MVITFSPNPITSETGASLTWTDTGFTFENTDNYLLYINGNPYSVVLGNNTNSITFTNLSISIGTGYVVRVTTLVGETPSYDRTAPSTLDVTCFVEGTEILCNVNGEEKYVEIQNIKVSDEIKTLNHGMKKVRNIVNFNFVNDKSISQICKIPSNNGKDLLVTGNHSLLVDSLTEQEKKNVLKVWDDLKKVDGKYLLLASLSNKCEKVNDSKTYNLFHLVLESEDEEQQFGVYANGILCETMSINCFEENQQRQNNNLLTVISSN